MKKTLLLIPLLLFPTIAQAEWLGLGTNEGLSLYVEPSSIDRKGSVVRYWMLYDYATVQTTDSGAPYRSMKAHIEVDCLEKQRRPLASSLHAEPMAGNEVDPEVTVDAPWTPVAPNTVAAATLEFVCRKK